MFCVVVVFALKTVFLAYPVYFPPMLLSPDVGGDRNLERQIRLVHFQDKGSHAQSRGQRPNPTGLQEACVDHTLSGHGVGS